MSAQPAQSQRWDPSAYGQNAGFVSALGLPLVGLLEPRSGMRVLDLGCGNGTLTEALIGAGCSVVGVDTSAEMIAAARARGIDARTMDGHALTFDAEFDAVFSNAALHWMTTDPAAVVAGVARALVPGGRFVGEMGGAGNISAIHAALAPALARRGIDLRQLMPKFFPSAETYRAMLEGAGFRVKSIELFPRPTPLPTGLSGWLGIFATPALAAVPASDRPALIAETEQAAAENLHTKDGWIADYVRLRFVAEKLSP